MEVSSLGTLAAGQKKSSEASSASEESRNDGIVLSSKPQGTSNEEAQTSPFPPVKQPAALSGEEGNSVRHEPASGGGIDVLA
mgnify:CR=1 FL=1|tara:strand:- start:487 stop:732 length:246 start_codon:yes stop_codon:yes gene_type:complete